MKRWPGVLLVGLYMVLGLGATAWRTLSLAAEPLAQKTVIHDYETQTQSGTGGPPESNRHYSLFMHHATGTVVLMLSGLVFADRLTGERSRLIRVSIGSVWLLLGIFLWIRADPEGWPIGPAGFLESFSMPTAGEWLQHKVLSLIPMLLGMFWLTSAGRSRASWWNSALAATSMLGALGLLRHQHAAHPGMDLVNVQHRLFAATALIIGTALVLEGWDGWAWKYKRLILPTGLLILGVQLMLFTE